MNVTYQIKIKILSIKFFLEPPAVPRG